MLTIIYLYGNNDKNKQNYYKNPKWLVVVVKFIMSRIEYKLIRKIVFYF